MFIMNPDTECNDSKTLHYLLAKGKTKISCQDKVRWVNNVTPAY